jgi:hypothetical protein
MTGGGAISSARTLTSRVPTRPPGPAAGRPGKVRSVPLASLAAYRAICPVLVCITVLMASVVFLGYPSRPPMLRETMANAARMLNALPDVEARTWEDLLVSGRVLWDAIC